jgi:hypothetical protein
MVKLTNVPCVIVTIKSYIGRDSGNEGEEGVTSKIKICGGCDFKDDKVTQSATQDITGTTVAINSYLEHDSGNNG